MVCSQERPLFVDSNLGTHFALSIPIDITANDLKNKIEQEHSYCFPEFGKIKVHVLLVKRKSYCYHLPDLMTIKHVFHGIRGSWFLRMDASHSRVLPIRRAVASPKTQRCTGHGSLCQGGQVESAINTPLTSGKSTSTNLQKYEEKAQVVATMQVLGGIEDSLSGISDVTVCSRPENSNTFVERDVARPTSNKDIKCLWRDEDLLAASKTESKRRKVLEEKSADYFVFQNVRESAIREAVDNKMEEVLGMGYRIDESPGLDHDKILLSEHQEISCKHSPSLLMAGTPSTNISEKISITGIIAKYFSESEEVNSSIKSPGYETDTKRLDRQGKDNKSSGDKQEHEFTCTSSISELSVQQSRTATSDAVTLSFSNMDPPNNSIGSNSKKLELVKRYTYSSESRLRRTDAKKEKTPSSAIANKCSEFNAHHNSMNKEVSSSKELVYQQVVNGTGHSMSLSSYSSLDKHLEASRSNSGRNVVGKRIIQAANNIGLHVSRRTSPISMFVSKRGGLCSAPYSPLMPKTLAFEITDSDGQGT